MKSYLLVRIQAFRYAIRGIRQFVNEPHARIHLISTLVVIVLGFILTVSNTEWYILLICCALVLSLEAINSSLEHLTDIASPEIQPKAGLVKDIAAGAVLIASIFAAIIGLMIFVPKIIELL